MNGAADMYNFAILKKLGVTGYWSVQVTATKLTVWDAAEESRGSVEGPLWESERGRGTRAEECVRRTPPRSPDHGRGRRTFRLCSYR